MPNGVSSVDLLRILVARGDTFAGLERLLALSPGYLSKVNRARALPSQQLLSLLRILVDHPEVRTTLLPKEPAPRGSPRKIGARQLARKARFLEDLEAAFRANSVRFQPVDDLLLEKLKVPLPDGLPPSLRFLIHPQDRHALATARALGAATAMANSFASVCTPADGSLNIVFVFPFEPLCHLFDRPELAALDAALYFALQHDVDAEIRMRAIASMHSLRRNTLQGAFARVYGDVRPLPQKEWLLRSTFDPDLARQRLAKLPR